MQEYFSSVQDYETTMRFLANVQPNTRLVLRSGIGKSTFIDAFIKTTPNVGYVTGDSKGLDCAIVTESVFGNSIDLSNFDCAVIYMTNCDYKVIDNDFATLDEVTIHCIDAPKPTHFSKVLASFRDTITIKVVDANPPNAEKFKVFPQMQVSQVYLKIVERQGDQPLALAYMDGKRIKLSQTFREAGIIDKQELKCVW